VFLGAPHGTLKRHTCRTCSTARDDDRVLRIASYMQHSSERQSWGIGVKLSCEAVTPSGTVRFLCAWKFTRWLDLHSSVYSRQNRDMGLLRQPNMPQHVPPVADVHSLLVTKIGGTKELHAAAAPALLLVFGAGGGTDPYTITCTNAADSNQVLPTGDFTVTATAEAGAEGCKQPGSKTTTITVTAPIDVTVTGDTTAAVSRQWSLHV
jgi:hypothetical protein